MWELALWTAWDQSCSRSSSPTLTTYLTRLLYQRDGGTMYGSVQEDLGEGEGGGSRVEKISAHSRRHVRSTPISITEQFSGVR